MASTITERVYDDLTHKLRQWEKMQPAPYEVLGAIKSWSQLGNADIEAAANAAAGLAVKEGAARSVKAFANVPDVPAALAHLRTAHAAIKAQVEAERSAPPRDGGFAGVKATKAVDAETAAQDMLRLSAKFDALAQQIQGANGFGAASRLFVNARRLYQSSIAKYGQFWTPDMQRIMKNTLDRVSMGAARDSSDPQSFLYHSMVTAARRVREWADDVRRNAG